MTDGDTVSLSVNPRMADWWGLLQATTEDEMREAMALIPAGVRERLALGPHPRRWTCGVCEAFGGKDWYMNLVPDMDDPNYIVYGYHEVPKLWMWKADDQWYGGLANETYRRCIATYRAAGWTGEAEEPNA